MVRQLQSVEVEVAADLDTLIILWVQFDNVRDMGSS